MKNRSMKISFIIVVATLLILSIFSTLILGHDANENNCEKKIADITFICYDKSAPSKLLYYREQLIKESSDDNSTIWEEITSVERTKLLSSGGPMDSSWPMKCHDNRHTSQSPYHTVDNIGVEKWRFETDGWIEDTPVIDGNGIIYFGGNYGGLPWYLYAVYPNGTLKWRYKTDGLILGSSPIIDKEGVIYIGSWDNNLYALYPNGTLKWRFNAHDTIASSPAIAEDGTIYFGTMGSGYNVYAVNPNGTEKWHYTTGYRITSDPAISNEGIIYIGSMDDYLYALHPNGTLCWRFKTGHYIKGSPSIAEDGTIYFGSYDDYLYALNPNGTMKWRVTIGTGTETNPSIANDGTIYVGDDRLYAIYPNGTLKWSFDLGPERYIHQSSPAISADGTIYIGTNIGESSGGEIIAVNSDGTERWRKRIADKWVESSPSIGEDGTVYIGSSYDMSSGYLYAFGRGELIIDAGGPYESMVNEEIQFTSTVSGGAPPYNYSWDFGDGNESYEQNPTHAYSTADTYTITLTVTDDVGNISSDNTIATITERDTNLEIDININGVTIENIGDVDAYNVEWNLNITGGIFGFIDEHLYDTKDSLPKGDKITVPLPRLIGLGQLKIAATAEADDAERVIKEADGFILLFFVII